MCKKCEHNSARNGATGKLFTGTIYFTGEDDVDQSNGVGEGARPRRRAWVRLRPRVVASN